MRRAIRDGALRPGARVPSTRDLARQLGVSRRVVVDAYAQLAAEGYLHLSQGARPRVSDAATAGAVGSERRGAGAGARASTSGPACRTSRRSRAPPGCARCARRWLDRRRRPRLRRPARRRRAAHALAEYLGRVRGVVAEPGRVVVTCGYSQGLGIVCFALAPAARAASRWRSPATPSSGRSSRAPGSRPSRCRSTTAGCASTRCRRTGADAVVVTPAHQHPTGAVLTPERRTALLAWLRARDAVAIEDDYDAEHRYDRAAVGALQGLAPDRVVYAGSASKVLAPALRVGWLVVPQSLIGAVGEEKVLSDRGTARIDQLAFAELPRRGDFDRHLRRTRARYRARRDAVVAALAEALPEATVRGIAAGLHVTAELPDGYDEERDRGGGAPPPHRARDARRLPLRLAAGPPDAAARLRPPARGRAAPRRAGGGGRGAGDGAGPVGRSRGSPRCRLRTMPRCRRPDRRPSTRSASSGRRCRAPPPSSATSRSRAPAAGTRTSGRAGSCCADRLSDATGAGAVPVSSGTSGLQVALAALRRRGPRRATEVLVPSFAFPAPAQAIVWNGLRPVFADVAADHWHLDPGGAGRRPRAPARRRRRRHRAVELRDAAAAGRPGRVGGDLRRRRRAAARRLRRRLRGRGRRRPPDRGPGLGRGRLLPRHQADGRGRGRRRLHARSGARGGDPPARQLRLRRATTSRSRRTARTPSSASRPARSPSRPSTPSPRSSPRGGSVRAGCSPSSPPCSRRSDTSTAPGSSCRWRPTSARDRGCRAGRGPRPGPAAHVLRRAAPDGRVPRTATAPARLASPRPWRSACSCLPMAVDLSPGELDLVVHVVVEGTERPEAAFRLAGRA